MLENAGATLKMEFGFDFVPNKTKLKGILLAKCVFSFRWLVKW